MTTACLYGLTQCVKMAQRSQVPLYVALLDISKAYDSVDRELLQSILGMYGLEERDVTLLRAFYRNVTAQVVWEGHVASLIEVTQGCSLSTLLFMLYVGGVIQCLEVSGQGCTCGLPAGAATAAELLCHGHD